MTSEFVRRINKDLNISVSRIEATIALMDAGATVPFIARYRKEATGNLDEVRIRQIAERYAFYTEFGRRRDFILRKLENKGVLSEELRDRIRASEPGSEIEDLYLPYRPKRASKASLARERGLEPLADHLQRQAGEETVEHTAASFVSEERGIPTWENALDGALDIIAERVGEDAEIRKAIRALIFSEGVVHSRAAAGDTAEKTRYSAYYDFREPVSKIPSHRFLTIRRGAREKILIFSVDYDPERARGLCRRALRIRGDCPWAHLLERAADDALSRLIEPSIQAEVRAFLRSRAEWEAIRTFQENLRALLLGPPAGQIPLLGVQPGLRSGARFAAIDATGRFLEAHTLPLTDTPTRDPAKAAGSLGEVLIKYGIRGIVIGNGSGSKEAASVVRSVVDRIGFDIFVSRVSEGGIGVDSDTAATRSEFPELDSATRRAIALARRMQDPLVELVKVDPKALCAAQHDINQNRLRLGLDQVLESSVNHVGVSLNSASVELLRYVAGIEDGQAQAIVDYRTAHGAFSSRQELLDVPGVTGSTFEQAVGFLRVENGVSALDQTTVHPESYPAVEHLATSLGVGIDELVGNSTLIQSADFTTLRDEVGPFTAADIRRELEAPGQDPRRSFVLPRFRDDVREVSDLKEGMELEGQVTNVTSFGAFVDLGVHQDGLVHISELSHGYVADARRAIGIGDLIRVRVISVDPQHSRISLSRKALLPIPKPRPRPRTRAKPRPEGRRGEETVKGTGEAMKGITGRRPQVKRKSKALPRSEEKSGPKGPAPPELSMEEKIRQLQEKFRGPDK